MRRRVTNQDLIMEALGTSGCLSYNDSYGGEPEGWAKRTIRELARRLDVLDRACVEALRDIPVKAWMGDREGGPAEPVCSIAELQRRLSQADFPIQRPGAPIEPVEPLADVRPLDVSVALRSNPSTQAMLTAADLLDHWHGLIAEQSAELERKEKEIARLTALTHDLDGVPKGAVDVLVVGPGWNEKVRALPGPTVDFVAVLKHAVQEDRDNALKSISKS